MPGTGNPASRTTRPPVFGYVPVERTWDTISDMLNPQLETFVAVAELGSFNQAAKALYVTPSAVIKQINGLETHLGLRLFDRSKRGLTLTKAGESLLADARYMVGYAKDSLERARRASLADAGELVRIGTSPMTPAGFLVDLWPAIHRLQPELKFELVPFENTPQNAREILGNLGRNIDVVAGVYDSAFLASRHCEALSLDNVPLRCAVSVHHPLAVKRRLRLADLTGYELMIIRRGWNRSVDALRDDLEARHRGITIVDFDFYSIDVFNQCEQRDAAILTIDYWHGVHPLFKVLPVDWDYDISFCLMHGPQPSGATQAMLDAVTKVAKV